MYIYSKNFYKYTINTRLLNELPNLFLNTEPYTTILSVVGHKTNYIDSTGLFYTIDSSTFLFKIILIIYVIVIC